MKSDSHEVPKHKSTAKITISGKVQGVFYRANAAEKAEELNLHGYAKNLSSGSVEILAQGRGEYIERLIEWCWKGSQNCKVDDVQVEWIHEKGQQKYDGFTTM